MNARRLLCAFLLIYDPVNLREMHFASGAHSSRYPSRAFISDSLISVPRIAAIIAPSLFCGFLCFVSRYLPHPVSFSKPERLFFKSRLFFETGPFVILGMMNHAGRILPCYIHCYAQLEVFLLDSTADQIWIGRSFMSAAILALRHYASRSAEGATFQRFL